MGTSAVSETASSSFGKIKPYLESKFYRATKEIQKNTILN